MWLKKLIRNTPKNIGQIKINGLSTDSRSLKKGNIFFAIRGSNLNGELFINDAIKKGAALIVCSQKHKIKVLKTPIIKVNNVKKVLTYACKKFYTNKPKNIIAVTGTNGKSSVAEFFRQILLLNKKKVASIGTLGIKSNNKIKKVNLTSLDIISLHKELNILKKKKIDNVILEASSHGLHQGRLDGLNFKAGVFTNFSQDHLDYHKSMKNYFRSKMILFSKLMGKNKHLIVDSKFKELPRIKKIIKKKLKIIYSQKMKINENNIGPKIIGNFQIKNLLMAATAASLCGIKKGKIYRILKKIKNVNSRLELTRTLPNKTKVFIDYAHTPDALETVLKSLKYKFNSKLTLVFGCGGERDIPKRKLMANIADNFCDKIYITDDNPRNENPAKIRFSIKKHIKKTVTVNIGNRKKAILNALKKSQSNEIILVAGKGHENYQIYKNKTIKVSDKNLIRKIIIGKSKIEKSDNVKILDKILNKRHYKNFKGVSVDSKKIKKNNLFIAIKGKKKDGHNYIFQALRKGAKYCVVSKKFNNINKKKLIKVDNTVRFLNKFAKEKRETSRAKIIAITGSNGKTSCKTILGNLLNNFSKTYFSPKSYNNHFGVPISLSNLNHNHQFGVFEIGMSNKGEIDNLSKIVKPDIAIITNIAEAHIQNFKNLRGIAKAKGEIIKNIKERGLLIINRDDRYFNYFNKLAQKRKIKVLSFGSKKNSNVWPVSIKQLKKYKQVKIQLMNKKITANINEININNILISLLVMSELKLNYEKIVNLFPSLNPLKGRGKIYSVNKFGKSFKLIDESYNANPFSVKNSILKFSKIKKKNFKKYLLLSDMLELGKKSDFYHKKLSQIINKTDIDKFFVYGDKILNTYKNIKKNKRGNILQHKKDFDLVFSKVLKKGDYLMIKGSNATGLNNLTQNIIGREKNAI